MSITTLKRIALVTMVLGYIGSLIPGMPVFLQWLGKLSAPLFFYCMAWSLTKTSDKKAYFRRLYIASVAMREGHHHPLYAIRFDYKFFTFLAKVLPARFLNWLIYCLYGK